MGRVRYIRDYLNGSTVNTGNHWVEIQAIDQNGENVALNKPVISNAWLNNGDRVTNGITSTTDYASSGGSLSYVEIDLGESYDIKELKVWHFYNDARTYFGTKTETSTDGKKFRTLYDSAIYGTYVETSEGRTYKVPSDEKRTDKLLINIFTTELEWMGQIDNVKSLIHNTSWNEIPTSELTISKYAQSIEEIQVGRILVVNNQRDKALIVEDVIATLNDEYITFTCISLKGMLNYRIAHPVDSGTYTQRKQSEVMMEIALGNLVTQTRDEDRKFWNQSKTKNMFRVAPIKVFGDTIDFSTSWTQGTDFLGDMMTNIAKMYGIETTVPLGWNVYITEDYSAFEMDVVYGRHKHINQTTLPPVIFSEEFGNIRNATYEYSTKEWKNLVYVVWDEPNVDNKRIQRIPNSEKGAVVSFNRKEFYMDSSKETLNEVTNEGRAELNKRPHIETFTAEIINNVNTMTTYKEDWILGDIVTVQSSEVLKNSTISIDLQITEIEEVYDSGEYTINATFGAGKLSFVQLVKQAIELKK